MRHNEKRLPAYFYVTGAGAEPVRHWLLELSKPDRELVGEEIKTIEYDWPTRMPTCRPMGNGLFEVRTHLKDRIARVLFCVHEGRMVLLHGFIKKTQKTPKADLDLARDRMKRL
jgi:phage-related protein